MWQPLSLLGGSSEPGKQGEVLREADTHHAEEALKAPPRNDLTPWQPITAPR